MLKLPVSLTLAVIAACAAARAQVVIHEIHYHPVELPAFDAAGNPVYQGTATPANFTDDVHEFVEIYNAGGSAVDLSGWKLSGGVDFVFPAGASIAAGGYKVVAKTPARIEAVYAGVTGVLGPYTGTLKNSGDTVRLKDAADVTVDSVSYDREFPWPDSPDALGAADDFTLLNSAGYQYKGRSLQRVSVGGGSNDPANWLASPLGSVPTPGSANAVVRAVPKPVVVAYGAVQAADDSPTIRASQQVRVTCTFSSGASLSGVLVEYFLDAIDGASAYSEPRSTMAMTALGNNQFTATLPGQVDRSVVRWRIKADRGDGLEQVFPRPDNAAIVPMGAASREAWAAYFVQPVRTTTKTAIYDVFVSNSDATNGAFNGLNGLAAMNYNITGNPKRVTNSANSGLPRDIPYVPATAQLWNGCVPCIFVENGRVRDAQLRYHGSRYNRSAGRNSFKVRFADTQLIDGADSFFVTDKGDYFSVAQGLYINANLPMSEVRWVDWYLNNNGALTRLQQGEYNGDLLDKYHKRIAALNPGVPKEETGEFYKDVGTIDDGGEGPYGHGSERRLFAAAQWTEVQRYEWTYTLQNHAWLGAKPMRDFLAGMWIARGDTHTAPNPNVPVLRAYLDAQLDVDSLLGSLAILNWMCPWDDTTQNHFLWRRANGKWNHVAWDFDGMFGNGDTTGSNSWIYLGENGTPPGGILGNNFRGPNWFKDSVFKAYRTEYNAKFWLLNNTYLHPDNLKTLFYRNSNGTLNSYYSFINGVKAGFCEARFQSVNSQTGHAADGSDFFRPNKPVNAAPVANAALLPPGVFTASAYAHSSGNTAGVNAHAKSKWEIRASGGDYFTPVFAVTSATSLTSLAIPFDQLTFGQTYFWRVTYFDGQDHPSFPSDETAFNFGPQSTLQTLLPFNASWKYDQTDAFNDPAWAATGFNDSTWPNGNGMLAFEVDAIPAPWTIGTPLSDPRSATGRCTVYFRKHFNVPVNPATLQNFRIQHMIDDGCVIYINGTRIHRYRMVDLAAYPYAQLAASGASPERVYVYADASNSPGDSSYLDPRPYLVQGDNVIAVEVHQNTFTVPGNSGNSSDVTMGLEITATVPATPGDVVINEVMADNRGAVVNGASSPDFIELKNTTAGPLNIGGNGLTDDILNPARYVFPANTIIPAGGYLLVWCDNNTADPGLHTGFGLDRGGQRVVLTNAGAIRDYVAFGPQATNLTIGRVADGTGGFTLTTPTPGVANTAVAILGAVTNVKVNEWMASPAHGEDWFELYNPDANPVSLTGLWLSDTPGKPQITQLPALSYLAGKGFADFVADGSNAGGNHVNFKLGGGGEWLLLTAANGYTTIDSVNFGSQTQNVSQGRLPDGTATVVEFPGTASRAESNWVESAVVVNEALANSVPPLQDYIELRNTTGAVVDVSGWWLSDDKGQRQKFMIPAGTTIFAGEVVVFNESQFNTGANAFSLSSLGDEIVLTAVSGGAETGQRSQVSFGASLEDISFGRVAAMPRNEFWPQTARTSGTNNASPVVTPVIINEVHYHPPDLAGADNARDEFVELHNPTTTAVDLSGWRLKGASDFTFAAGTQLRPGDYILVVSFDPVASPGTLAAFQTALNVPAGTRVYGPYAPKLANDEASVELARPGTPVSGATPYVNVDKIEYSDLAPWPVAADGTGPSLQRLSRLLIGNTATNWQAATPTPGAVNTNETAILDNDGDGMPNTWEDLYGLDKFNAADAALDFDSDGQTNLAEYLAGTAPNNSSDTFVAQMVSAGGGQFKVRFQAKAGKTYTIQYKNALSDAQWQKLADLPPPPTDMMMEYQDPATGLTKRFYRVITP
jgi:hypothetical protein